MCFAAWNYFCGERCLLTSVEGSGGSGNDSSLRHVGMGDRMFEECGVDPTQCTQPWGSTNILCSRIRCGYSQLAPEGLAACRRLGGATEGPRVSSWVLSDGSCTQGFLSSAGPCRALFCCIHNCKGQTSSGLWIEVHPPLGMQCSFGSLDPEEFDPGTALVASLLSGG